MTPEGKIKKKTKKVLDKYKGSIYFYMPVPGGYGKQTVDYLGIFGGIGFAIEAKADGKPPTPNQQDVLDDVVAAGGVAFVINDDASVEAFAAWLEQVNNGEVRIVRD